MHKTEPRLKPQGATEPRLTADQESDPRYLTNLFEEKKESTSTPMTAKEAIFELRSTPTYKLEPKTWEAASDEEERIRLLIEKFSFPENKDKDIRYSSITVNRMLKLAIREAISPSSKLF